MDVRVVSKDEDLIKLCRDVLAELALEQSFSITTSSAETFEGEADLYIWDFDSSVSLPSGIDSTSSSLIVLVHSRDLPAAKAAIAAETTVVLKPVTRATFSALLSFALSNPPITSLRADRDELFQRLLQANLKLQQYDQNRTDFLARVVHDFRAPLTALTGYSGLLLGEPLGSLNEGQKEVVQRMHLSIRRLSRLADGLLQLSVPPYVRRGPDRQRADITKCLQEALDEIRPLGDDKKLEIQSDLVACGDHLYFDPGQITQVFVNVLENSCKFVPRRGLIEIRGYPWFWERRRGPAVVSTLMERRSSRTLQPNSYRIDIRDSGGPIAEENLRSIFDEYVSRSAAGGRSGSGLGLTICRGIIDQHSGRMWAENTPDGPVFSFVLPMREAGFLKVNLAG